MIDDHDDNQGVDYDFHVDIELTKDFEIFLDDEGDYEIINKDD